MTVNLKVLISDDDLVSISEGGVGQRIFGNNDNHYYSALGEE